MTRQPTLVVIDDEPSVLTVLSRFARALEFEVRTYSDAREALSDVDGLSADAAFVDLCMPEIGGLDVLRALRHAHPECQVVLMTGNPSVETAIEAVKLGALDYVGKPLDFERLKHLLSSVRDDIDRRTTLLAADGETARRLELCGMIGRSAVMQELFGMVRRIAPHARVALITGETGVGKEGIARAIHDLGPRRHMKFVTINCSAVVETLFESELFGHVKGAFTGATENKRGLFEAADGGTVFLDEVGELPPNVQAKLLRVLETGEVQRVGSLQARKLDVRVVAATNRELQQEAEAGSFRSDLYYRLNVVELNVPPLRERPEDLPYLTAAFVREFSSKFNRVVEGLTPGAERMLREAAWPGNVRQLRNVLERACMLADTAVLTERDIAAAMPQRPTSARRDPRAQTAPRTLADDVGMLEREQIERVLHEVRGNKTEAARRLGLSRRTLYRKLAAFRSPASSQPDAI